MAFFTSCILDGSHNIFSIDNVAHFILGQRIALYGQRAVNGLDTVGLQQMQSVCLLQSDGVTLRLCGDFRY